MSKTTGLPPSIRCQFTTYGPMPGQRDRCPRDASVFRNGGWYCPAHDPLRMLLEREEADLERQRQEMKRAKAARRGASTPADKARAKQEVASRKFHLFEQQMMVDQYRAWMQAEETTEEARENG